MVGICLSYDNDNNISSNFINDINDSSDKNDSNEIPQNLTGLKRNLAEFYDTCTSSIAKDACR